MSFHADDRGVSVIIGALLLILITVVAAAGLAMIVSEAEKQQMDRQAHIRAVESEQLKVSNIELVGDSSYWKSMNVTIVNMNIADSRIMAISLNDIYATNYTVDGIEYNVSRTYTIPATKSVIVNLNMSTNFKTARMIGLNEQVRVEVTTGYINFFNKTIKPPTAIANVKMETQDLGIAIRDFITLDGSGSTDDGAILGWEWEIIDAHKTYPVAGIWSDSTNITTIARQGKLSQVYFNSSGPFKVKLTVTDDTGMKGISNEILLPVNRNFNPPAYVIIDRNGSVINATVLDLDGKPVEGVMINFIVQYDVHKNLTLLPWSNMTNLDGVASTTILSGNGTIAIYAGRLTPISVSV